MATGDMTTLASVKEYLEIATADTSVDSLLGRLITESSQQFVNDCNRQILSRSYTDQFSGSDLQPPWARNSIWGGLPGVFLSRDPNRAGNGVTLRNYPVISVASLTIDNNVIPARDSADVTADGWVLVGDRVQLNGWQYLFSRGISNIVVVYTAGYAAVPSDVEGAVIRRCAFELRRRRHLGQKSIGVGRETVSFGDECPGWDATVANYLRVQLT
jgi:hypothetical protein